MPPPNGVGILPQLAGAVGTAGSSWGQSDNAVSGGIDRTEKINKKPLPPLKRKKKVVETDTTPVLPAKGSANRVRDSFIAFSCTDASSGASFRIREQSTITKETLRLFRHIKRPTLLKTDIRTRMGSRHRSHIPIPIRSLGRLMDAP